MSDPRQPFLRAIEQDFDDDTPRLVFADWLDENGEPDRAAFIRLQCEADRVPPGQDRAQMSPAEWERHWHAATTADELLRIHGSEWTAGLPDWRGYPSGFHRGFLHIESWSGHQLVNDGAAVRAVTPVGGGVRLWGLEGREDAVFRCEHLENVTRLSLWYAQLSKFGIRELAASPVLSRLESLDLTHTRGTDKDVAVVLRSPQFPNLRRLALSHNPTVTDSTARVLLADGRRWERIDLDGTGVSVTLREAIQARCEANR